MQIVIDIPEVFYEALKKTDEIVSGQRSGKTLMSVVYSAVANGTPLPKGHGDLIDRKSISYENTCVVWSAEQGVILECNAPTIIKADKR